MFDEINLQHFTPIVNKKDGVSPHVHNFLTLTKTYLWHFLLPMLLGD